MPQHIPLRGELAVLETIGGAAGRLPKSRLVKLGIGDDCAVLAPPAGTEVVVTTDFSLEGRHFLRDRHPARSVGHRVLARGLSDLAAMGAEPMAAFLSLALPAGLTEVWLDGFLEGFSGLARATRTPLAGGDTSESPTDHVLADVMLLGTVPAGRALRRSGARVGDAIYVTGSLGGSAAELERVLAASKVVKLTAGLHPHLIPQPRLGVGRKLVGKASAAMDVSDGLSTDLTHLCEASGVSAEVALGAIPLGSGATMEQALHGGEDYELLFTASVTMPAKVAGVAITRIGTVTRKRRDRIVAVAADGTRTPLAAGGWEHLR